MAIEPPVALLQSSLRINCEIDDKRFEIMWYKNGILFAENCINFRILPLNFTCIQNGTFVELLFRNVEYGIKGNWSCQHGDNSDEIEVNVTVPLIMKASKIRIVPTNIHSTIAVAITDHLDGGAHKDASFGAPLSNSKFFAFDRATVTNKPAFDAAKTIATPVDATFGIGTRASPINLIKSQLSGVHSVEIECSSNCASQPTSLRWTIRNTTIISEHESQMVSNDDCPDGLSTARIRATFTCLIRFVPGALRIVPPNGHNPPPLVGLNRITCAPGSLGRHIERSLLHLTLGCSSPEEPAANSLDGNCLRNGNRNSVCLFIICPGPPAPILTYGEKVVLEIGAVQAVFMVALLLWLVVVRRRGENLRHRPRQRHHGVPDVIISTPLTPLPQTAFICRPDHRSAQSM